MRAVRYVGQNGSQDAVYQAQLKNGDGAVIDTISSGANVTLRFKINDRPLQMALAKDVRDLLDLAVCIYIMDEMDVREAAPDHWTRTMELVAPVADVERWAGATPQLTRLLELLAGDAYHFHWTHRGNLGAIGRHRARLPRTYDVVCLFSGGIDSLLGAYHLLAGGRRVLLVGHQADGTTAAAQTTLARQLRLLFPGRASLVQCRMARSPREVTRFTLPDKVEESHRPRSLLFLALAVAIAKTIGAGEVYIPENGLIALNPPLQLSRMGSLTTRTAHPAFLDGFASFLAEAGLYDGTIRNPFLYQSKTDMLATSPAQLRPLLSRSISCARPSRYNHRGVRHCGYCVPCIYRRAAMMTAGLDRPQDYAFDVFTGFSLLDATKQMDFRALVRFAQRVIAATPIQRQAMVLSHGIFSPDVGGRIGPYAARDLSPYSGMLHRWSEDFVAKVAANGSPATRRTLGMR